MGLTNLEYTVRGAISVVNPNLLVTIQQSSGYITNPDGKPVPQYITTTGVNVQMQPLQYQDIMHLDALNVQGIRRKFWIQGAINGLVRVNVAGGDLIITPDGNVWLVAFIAEQWGPPTAPIWCSAVATLQDGS